MSSPAPPVLFLFHPAFHDFSVWPSLGRADSFTLPSLKAHSGPVCVPERLECRCASVVATRWWWRGASCHRMSGWHNIRDKLSKLKINGGGGGGGDRFSFNTYNQVRWGSKALTLGKKEILLLGVRIKTTTTCLLVATWLGHAQRLCLRSLTEQSRSTALHSWCATLDLFSRTCSGSQ